MNIIVDNEAVIRKASGYLYDLWSINRYKTDDLFAFNVTKVQALISNESIGYE